MKKTFFTTILALFSLLVITSCHKDHPISYITIQNNTNSDISVSLNGASSLIHAASEATFSGGAGGGISGQALTANLSAGVSLQWSLSGYSFPPSGTVVIPINVSSDYFFLYVKNNSTRNVIQVDVNYNNTAHTTDYVTIPNDNYIYGVGYYDAYSYSNVQLTLSDNSTVNWPSLSLPVSNNQYFNAYFP